MNILVTGIGAVSGIGLCVGEHIDAIREGRSGMGPARYFQTRLQVPVCEVKRSNQELADLLSLPAREVYTRTALLGMLAAREALTDAGIDVNACRVGLISATSVGGMDRSERFYSDFHRDGVVTESDWICSHDCGESTRRIAGYLGITGFCTTVSTACSSAANAIMMGARMIRHGLLDVVLVGGTDALCRFTLNGFNSLMILDKEPCRPFDRSRAGLNLGEGAGFLVLQGEHTRPEKAYARLSGYANANDAFHQTASSPDGDGPFLCMREAVAMAGLSPAEIDYINVHGTGTPNNDLSEGKAMLRLFGEEVPPFSSLKAFLGHTLGASEGIEAVLSVLSVKKGYVYPNLNFSLPIDELGLLPETRWAEGRDIRHVLSNSFGFGGNDSALVFSSI